MATIETYTKPIRLYRFRSLRCINIHGEYHVDLNALERELQAIEGRYIYCPVFTQMNDPMEGFYRASTSVRERRDYDNFTQSVRDEKLGIGIASLSETWNNELMWAHYADSFRGICISYSVSRLLSGLPQRCALSRVAYGDKPYFLNLAAMRGQTKARAILSTKNLKWSYEREWRLFSARSGRAYYRNDAISSVYLGARMSEADQELIRERLLAAGIRVRRTLVDGYAVERTDREGGAQ
jgi:DUF2971 family protein